MGGGEIKEQVCPCSHAVSAKLEGIDITDLQATIQSLGVEEETIEEDPHIHLWTVKCHLCRRVMLVRTIGCNCKLGI